MPGFAIDRPFGVTLGYEPAVRLDGVPGQNLSRQVIVVHDGRAYKLVFVLADEAQGEVYHEMEALYDSRYGRSGSFPNNRQKPHTSQHGIALANEP